MENDYKKNLIKNINSIEDKYIIKNINSIEDKYIMLRLLEDYHIYENEKNNYLRNEKIHYTIIAFETIKKQIERVENNFNNTKMKKIISNYFLLLKHLINNYDINNKKLIDYTEETITILESILKIDITFPEKLKNCINNKFRKITTLEKRSQNEESKKYNIK